MPPYCSCGVIQVSGSPDIHIRLKTMSFIPCFKSRNPPEVAKLAYVSISDGPGMHLVGRYQQTFRQHGVNDAVSS